MRPTFTLQLTVKGGQHRQAAMGQTLGLEGNGEKLKEGVGGARQTQPAG
jgi:hypothetical protein